MISLIIAGAFERRFIYTSPINPHHTTGTCAVLKLSLLV